MKKREPFRKSSTKSSKGFVEKQVHNHPLRRLERFVNRAVPFVLIALAIVIAVDNPLWTLFDLEEYDLPVFIFDTIVLAVLIVDLMFKWMHVRNLKTFLRVYWLELIAVFPFYLIFRVYLVGLEVAKAGEEVQRVFHEIILTRETRLLQEARFFQAAERSFQESRPFVRLLRSGARLLRIIGFRLRAAYHNILKVSFKHR